MVTRVDAGFVVGFDGVSHRILRDGVVVFDGDRVVHVGKSYSGAVDEVIDARRQLVIPGFVDLHCHMTQSPLSMGTKEDLPRDARVPGAGTLSANRWVPEPWMGGALVRSSVWELLRSGVTTVVELGAPDWLGYKESVELLGGSGLRTYLSAGYRSGVRVDGELKHDNEMGFKQMQKHTVTYHAKFVTHNAKQRGRGGVGQQTPKTPSLAKTSPKTSLFRSRSMQNRTQRPENQHTIIYQN